MEKAVIIGTEAFTEDESIVINNFSVYNKYVLGAATTAIQNFEQQGTYIGAPAGTVK